MKIIVTRKEIKANAEYLNTVCDAYAGGSVAFLADIPKNAIVTGVYINGKSLEDYSIEPDYISWVHTAYPRNEMFEGHRVAAVISYVNGGGTVYDLAISYTIDSFVVEYIDVAIAEE